ncbi:MAG: lytic murein transglycosylase B [Thiohalobacteraceae bacterium]
MHQIRNRIATLSLLLLQWPLLASCATTPTSPAYYTALPEARVFVDEMVERHQLPRAELEAMLAQAERQQSILDAIARPAEAKPWRDYRPIFLTEARINGGVDFWNTNAAILAEASAHFGVDTDVIVAIIGVETRYGSHTGRYRVLDALATLAFDYPPRSPFFRSELEQFFLLVREEAIDPLEAKGSYAGAMGQGQFIPSSYRRYAVDFDGDGRRDLWNSERDVLGSVANYLKVHGWVPGAPVVARAQVRGDAYRQLLDKGLKPHLPAGELARYGVVTTTPIPAGTPVALIELEGAQGLEQWVVFNNFYVITRYNRSPLYAMAVHQLGVEVATRRAGR